MSGAGKDTVAHYLEEQYGWTHVSLSKTLRCIVEEQYGLTNLSMTQNSMYADMLREQFGPTFLIDHALSNARGEDVVLSSMYACGEAQRLREVGGIVVAIAATEEVRFNRIRSRGEVRDKSLMDFKQFVEQSKRELGENGYQDRVRIEYADYIISNNYSLRGLYADFDMLVQGGLVKSPLSTS